MQWEICHTIRLSLDIQGRIERPCPSVISWLNSSRTQITEIFAESQLGHFLSIIEKKKKKGRRHAWVPFASPISNEHFLGLELSKMQHSTVRGGPTEFYSENWSIIYAVSEISFYFLVWHFSNSIWNSSISSVKSSWTSLYYTLPRRRRKKMLSPSGKALKMLT